MADATSGVRIVSPEGRNLNVAVTELWRRRELLWIFLKRQIAVRYRQMIFGVFWAVLEPLALLLIMTLVFGMLLRVNTGGYPYPVFAFAGLIPWMLFSRAATSASSSLIDNIGVISKVEFPRLILPIVATLREAFDSTMMIFILVALAAAYGYPPTLKLVAVPLLLGYAAVSALMVGLWLSAAMVPFRDVRPILTLLLQAGMYATPILYPPTLVPKSILPYYQINPMYWCVEFFRWMLLGHEVTLTFSFYVSIVFVAVTLLVGLAIFNAGQKKIVDVQ